MAGDMAEDTSRERAGERWMTAKRWSFYTFLVDKDGLCRN